MTPAEKAVYDRAYRAKNKARITEKKRADVLANFGREQARVKAWVEANRERSHEIKTAWRERNPGYVQPAVKPEAHAKRLEYKKAYYRRNVEAYKLYSLVRCRRAVHATPPWADKAAIKAVYAAARAEGKHVDHIVPLLGKTVCGLHVANNLQPLTPAENRKKGNRHAG
jgi:hypothetical protein